ncbi:DUF1801 domain-containing protein [uncultured Roseivirga sp.]|uniref:DUF1801 domain-containing protein n=1 Tax=uncultured Roseivirga sp. TaxID=543088 RepID=UPI0030DAC6AB|tara:strand:- start:84564 stop:84953 length:390 start_codon:yes stop_codon:yes gene_type:complete
MQPNSQQVIDFLDQAQHPLRSEIDYLRNIINNSAPELTEHIKWNAPSFMLNGDDCITFNLPPNQKTIRLVFHQGAKKKEQPSARFISDTPDWFKWATNDRAVVTFSSKEDIKSKEEQIITLIKEWVSKN